MFSVSIILNKVYMVMVKLTNKYFVTRSTFKAMFVTKYIFFKGTLLFYFLNLALLALLRKENNFIVQVFHIQKF